MRGCRFGTTLRNVRYVIKPPQVFQLDRPTGRGNTVEAVFGSPNDPGQHVPGSVRLRLQIKGYPSWRGVRADMREVLKRPITSPGGTAALARALSRRFYPAFREFFLVLALDGKYRVLAWYVAAIGVGGSVQVSLKDLFRNLLLLPSQAYIVVHNHPSGDATPSAEDIALTEALVAGSGLLGVQLLDHLIVGADGAYSSLAELGHL